MLIRGSRRGLLASAHDLAEGGLAQALVESALLAGTGWVHALSYRRRLIRSSGCSPKAPGAHFSPVKEFADSDLVTLCRINGVMLTRLGVVHRRGGCDPRGGRPVPRGVRG